MFLSDLKNGYLHAYLSEEQPIYMEVPSEFAPIGFTAPCVRIVKALYGLPSSGFDFFTYTKDALISEGWQPVDNFLSLYSKEVNGEHLLLGVYVDDFLFVAHVQT